jgi:hypothetical protein
MKVNILGTDYEIITKKYNEDEAFERRNIDGYCDPYQKLIVVCNMSTYPNGWENEPEETCENAQKHTLRHEIVHAFLSESGLDCSAKYSDCWAKNEEMVDWIALQGQKLYKAWEKAGCLQSR